MKIFDKRIFLKHQSVLQWNISVQWDKTSTENRDTPLPSYAWKFSIKEFFWHIKVFSNEIFRYSETKTSTENRDTPPPPLIHKIFFLTRNFLKYRMVPWRSFSVLWDKKNFDKTVKLPPSFAWNFSIPEFFRKTEGFSYEFYWHCERKIFQRSLVISPSYA